ncbi:hypothetical protein I6A84_34675 [Frankia sp. CNm7]|uniref:Uncharacterized protein n=1 Tax=Frankia nepalensis TaxID=1836974 RepID=A0A937USW2_9ACTN|nr:hypothetical protein [Frankia nepalensis]MBL7498024.1 hypothetical protein [Frankia nepalensis]MBL7515404.1 hypothetical protein [Frankia nepalensis]MBL7523093.1 hypothetical protein [Frankia nepalensis]MBL7629326.1 hypothetical protein [Frankia nepalensis]
MLIPFDDYPVHQTALPLAHAGDGHPDQYDRFWFNGYDENMYFAVALGLYPNRGIIDAAFSVVHDGVQRSVFASGRIPLDRTQTRIGPITVEIVEPMRVNRVVVDAPEHGLAADLTATARTPAYEEPRQTRHDGTLLTMDVTRATQMVTWAGTLSSGGENLPLSAPTYGTKDRSWGVRGVGDPAPAAPRKALPQLCFLWAPLNFADECLHFLRFEDAHGVPWSETAAVLPVIDTNTPVYGPDTGIRRLSGVAHQIRWAPGLRRSEGAALLLSPGGSPGDIVELEPIRTFRMKGVGYLHPTWGHGKWHGEFAVGGEAHKTADLDVLAFDTVHVQQVMRARWGERAGLGVLEQCVFGPYAPGGFTGLLDGARARTAEPERLA